MIDLTLEEAALKYAKLGLKVFPLYPGSTHPLTEHSFSEACTDTKVIKKWWRKEPYANIGIVTGRKNNGLIVVDIEAQNYKDIYGYGYYSFISWEGQHGTFPISWLSITGQGSCHLYLHTDKEIKSQNDIIKGVNIRGDDDYVIAPPSMVSHIYYWENEPWDFKLAEADSLLKLLLDTRYGSDFMLGKIEGDERQNALIKQARAMRSRRYSSDVTFDSLIKTNETILEPALSQNEIRKIICDVYETACDKHDCDLNYPTQATTVEDGIIKPLRKNDPIRAVTAAELETMDIAPIEWLVERILPVGLSMIGAPSKYYKSYMALGLCVEICSGGTFLGHVCHKHSCLYFDLESTKRRPKERLEQILNGREPPDNLFIITGADDVGRIGDEFEKQLEDQLTQHPDIKLVIIDVFQKIRQAAKRNQSGYDRDYDDLKVLKQIADTHDIGVMLIHHSRKMKDTEDVFNDLSGSVGIMGALDAAWVITRDSRDSEESVLHVTGRDMESINLQILFNKNIFQWESLGTAEEIASAREVDEYNHSPIVNTIRKLIDQNDGHWQGTVEEIKNSSKYFGCHIYDDVRLIGRKIRDYRGLLWAMDRIEMDDKSHTGKDRSRILSFYRIKSNEENQERIVNICS